MERRHSNFVALFSLPLALALLVSTARCNLIISSVQRSVDLSSHIVRVISMLEIENEGPDDVSELLLSFPQFQAKNLAAGLLVVYLDHKNKFAYVIQAKPTSKPKVGFPSDMSFFSIALPEILENGNTVNINVLAMFTHSVKPFPEEITQAESQLVLYTDTTHYISPYTVKYQSLVFMLPGRVESYTKYPNVTLADSELRYGPFEEQPAFAYSPITIHYEHNNPFPVASDLVREIEVSHWGNVQVTDQYTLVNAGARLKNGFSRLEYETKPYAGGAPSLRTLVATLPPRAHSVYYRDELGNISTSHLWSDSQKTQLEIELRFPLFGGWQTMFIVGYSLPLHDFLFESDGDRRVLNLTFGCPIRDLLVEKHIVKVVLPEGSKDIEAVTQYSTKKSQEVKYSHLDFVGRPVVVLEMENVTPEHNQYFLVYYKFKISLLRKPMILVFYMLILFVTFVVYMHIDLTISKGVLQGSVEEGEGEGVLQGSVEEGEAVLQGSVEEGEGVLQGSVEEGKGGEKITTCSKVKLSGRKRKRGKGNLRSPKREHPLRLPHLEEPLNSI